MVQNSETYKQAKIHLSKENYILDQGETSYGLGLVHEETDIYTSLLASTAAHLPILYGPQMI